MQTDLDVVLRLMRLQQQKQKATEAGQKYIRFTKHNTTTVVTKFD
jgi:hypothetical protein